jgi:hypothetical protein
MKQMKQEKRILFLLLALRITFFTQSLNAADTQEPPLYKRHKKLLIGNRILLGSSIILSILVAKIVQQTTQARELQKTKDKLTEQINSFKNILEQKNIFLSNNELLKMPSSLLKHLKRIQGKIDNLLNSQEKPSIEQELDSLMMQDSSEWMTLVKKYIPDIESDEKCLALFKALQPSSKRNNQIFHKNFIDNILLFARYQKYLDDIFTGIEDEHKIDEENGNTARKLIQQLVEKITAQQTKFDTFFQEHIKPGTCQFSTRSGGACEESCYKPLYLLIVDNQSTLLLFTPPDNYRSTEDAEDAFKTGNYYIDIFSPEIKKIHDILDSYPCCICLDDKSKLETLFFSYHRNQYFLCKQCQPDVIDQTCPICRAQMNINNKNYKSIKCE